jgi:probable F420-dependent oxidoreductase
MVPGFGIVCIERWTDIKDFRFGVCVREMTSRSAFADTVRRFEGLGFDVLSVPDHLGAVAPFPALTAAAQATATMRLGTYVLNAGFYKPALLGRDAAHVHLVSDGRLELGLGAGYVQAEFEAAELPFPGARDRVDHLTHVTDYIKREHPGVPVLVAGDGDRVLTLAARRADIVGLTGGPGRKGESDPLAARVAFIRAAAGDRFADLELNLMISAAPSESSAKPDLAMPRRHAPDLPEADLLAFPGVMTGTPRDIADTLRDYRDRLGVTYITVLEPFADYIAKAIAELR